MEKKYVCPTEYDLDEAFNKIQAQTGFNIKQKLSTCTETIGGKKRKKRKMIGGAVTRADILNTVYLVMGLLIAGLTVNIQQNNIPSVEELTQIMSHEITCYEVLRMYFHKNAGKLCNIYLNTEDTINGILKNPAILVGIMGICILIYSSRSNTVINVESKINEILDGDYKTLSEEDSTLNTLSKDVKNKIREWDPSNPIIDSTIISNSNPNIDSTRVTKNLKSLIPFTTTPDSFTKRRDGNNYGGMGGAAGIQRKFGGKGKTRRIGSKKNKTLKCMSKRRGSNKK